MWMSAALFLTAALGSSAASSEVETNFYLRAQALAADEACEFLSDPERDILQAGLAQARRDLASAGADSARVESALSRIRTDRRLAACDSEPVQELAGHARAAAIEVMRQPAQGFQGPRRSWRVDRTRYDFVRWPVLQQMEGARFGRAVLRPDPNLRDRIDDREQGAALVLAGESAAVSAILVLRDIELAPRAYDRTLGGLLSLPDGAPLARYSAPPHAERRIFASQKLSPEHAQRLFSDANKPEGAASGFVFPDSALEALARLAPGEAAAVELYNARGERIDRLWIEAGHLRAALTFAALPYEPEAAVR